MLAAFVSALKTPDLRKKILFTLAMVAVYRLGATIPSPGVSYTADQISASTRPAPATTCSPC